MNKDTNYLGIKTVAAAGCERRIVDARTPQEL